MNVFKSFSEVVARLGIEPRHIVHVGAHEGQEVIYYRQSNFQKITLVEPIPELASRLRETYSDVEVVECACADTQARMKLHVTHPTNMSTLITPQPHDRVQRTIEVDVRRLFDVAPTANVAVVDAQGAELQVLRGTDLSTLDLLIVETCTVDDPTVAAHYDDVVRYVFRYGLIEDTSWIRDYARVINWARKTRTPVVSYPGQYRGEIRDVVFRRR